MSFNTAMNIAPKKPATTRANMKRAIRPRKLMIITPETFVSKIIAEKNPAE